MTDKGAILTHGVILCCVCVCVHSLQVKVILSNRFSSFVIFIGHESIGQPEHAVFMLPLGRQHSQHQDQQYDYHRHAHKVW